MSRLYTTWGAHTRQRSRRYIRELNRRNAAAAKPQHACPCGATIEHEQIACTACVSAAPIKVQQRLMSPDMPSRLVARALLLQFAASRNPSGKGEA